MAPHTESATPEQINALLDFLDEHRDLARGKLRGADGRIRANRLWEEICTTLNSMGSCVKTVKQWQKVWSDKKYLAKRAAADSHRSASATGGGPSTAPQLSGWELKILSIMGEGFGRPQTGARVPAFPENPPSPSSPPTPSGLMDDEPVSAPQPINLDILEIADATELINQAPESVPRETLPSRRSSQRRRTQRASASVRSRLFQFEEERAERELIRNRELASIRATLQELCGIIREYFNRI